MPTARGWADRFLPTLSYSSPRHVKVVSWRLTLVYWAATAGILVYVGVVMIYQGHGYQEVSTVIGSVDAKVKGQVLGRGAGGEVERLWDSSDITIPQAFGTFVGTRMSTIIQTQGPNVTCVGSDPKTERCTGDPSVCQAGKLTWNGMMTTSGAAGCRKSDLDGESYCEIRGWCQTDDHAQDLLFEGVEDMTVFIRTSAKFPRFRDAAGEVYHWTNTNGTELQRGWNEYTMRDIVRMAGIVDADGNADFAQVAAEGADLVVSLEFDCDLDGLREALVPVDRCLPKIPFPVYRIDPQTALSNGYNVRRVQYLEAQGRAAGDPAPPTLTRQMDKLYGVRLRFQLAGTGRRFDMASLVVHIGSGLAFLGLASVIADFLLLNVFPRKSDYAELKYKTISFYDAARGLGRGIDDAPLLGGGGSNE